MAKVNNNNNKVKVQCTATKASSKSLVRVSTKSKSKFAGKRGLKMPDGHTKHYAMVLLDGEKNPRRLKKTKILKVSRRQNDTEEVEEEQQQQHERQVVVDDINNDFAHLEDADESDMEADNDEPPSGWTCPTCQYENSGLTMKCVNNGCDYRRPFVGWGGTLFGMQQAATSTWKCNECFFTGNPIGTSTCASCQTARSE